jgi:hypothetical protein
MTKYLLVTVAALSLAGCDLDALTDSPKEHQERLACEMVRMSGEYGHALSAEDAEAYCDKQMEAKWLSSRPAS